MSSSKMMCEYHMRGVCRYGVKCRKMHNPPNPELDTGTSRIEASELKFWRAIMSHRIMEMEASMSPTLRRPDNCSTIVKKQAANDLSVAMKTGNGNSEKDNAGNFHEDQKRMKNSTENYGSAWDTILMSAIDNNLLCNICFEIFIKPTVLNCSHTFCESCIHIWTIRHCKSCPVCRVEVKSKSYCLSLETFIENIVEHLPKEFKIKRETEIKERNTMKYAKPQPENRGFDRPSLGGLTYRVQQAEAAALPSQYQHMVDRNVHFSVEFSANGLEMSTMSPYDPVVHTSSRQGVNRQASYFVDLEEIRSNMRRSRFQ